ncbi:MAG: DUF2336 domain-containing protein [Phreatobacter sp.]|uniref:DUF2336 domain-containing protein n=1 Tax=Phreatobacter sp. TaxID=1966341 RepID=UPI001A577A33|nr:DUF2336 domain-containing protein [Phreatobacter sp.]MBL8569538.1 DUF2336 domain-containing protein [Phreatobacter sp.]
MLPSLENPVEQVLAAVDQMTPQMQQALVGSILAQFGPDRLRPSIRAQERLDRIVAHLLPPMAIAERAHFARAFGALDLDLPRTFAAIDKDEELVSEISQSHRIADAATIRTLGKHRRFIDMRIMAGRDDLSAEAAETLAEAGDARTVRHLAANARLELSPRARERLVTRASHDHALQEQLCARRDLGLDDARRLAAVVPDSMKPLLYEKLDKAAVEEAQKSASDAIPAKVRRMRLEQDTHIATEDVRRAVQAGSMSLSEAVTLLAVTDRVLPAVESLGEALGITRDALVATLARGRLEPFEALGRAVALNEHVHVSLVEAICRRWRRTAPDRRSILGRYGRVTEAMIDAELRPLKPAAPRAATTTRIFDIAAESPAAS